MAKSTEAKLKNAGLSLAKALNKASEAMLDFQLACAEFDGAPTDNHYRPDARDVLGRDMKEYAGYLERRFDR